MTTVLSCGRPSGCSIRADGGSSRGSSRFHSTDFTPNRLGGRSTRRRLGARSRHEAGGSAACAGYRCVMVCRPTSRRPRSGRSRRIPNAPRFDARSAPAAMECTGRAPVALACSPTGRLAADHVGRRGRNVAPLCAMRPETGRRRAGCVDAGQPATVAWYSDKRIVVLPAPRIVDGQPTVRARGDRRTTRTTTPPSCMPAGGFLPVRELAEALFLQGVTLPPHYPISGVDTPRCGRSRSPLSPARAWRERASLTAERSRPSGIGSASKRSFRRGAARASSSPRRTIRVQRRTRATGIRISSAKCRRPRRRDADLPGTGSRRRAASGCRTARRSRTIPGLLGRAPEPGRAGLFTALVQRPGRRVRRLAGRYLHMRVRLFGAGHLTPEIAASRVYGSRFSYRDQYLPEVYREDLFGATRTPWTARPGRISSSVFWACSRAC